ncbi:site-specific integrase [Sorangium sp. So ce693]|uniref:site-specific integrase n=1 Tax=Sorangium sp. So ce693 TaxID=3133318 RepID=UPI003F5DBAFB
MTRYKAALPSTELERLFEGAAMSATTRRAYGVQWRQFTEWCSERGGWSALPARPRVVVLYLAELAREGLSAGSLRAACTAIAKAHELTGCRSPLEDPLVVRWRRQLLEELATEPQQVTPLTAAQMRQIVTSMDDDLVAIRDRALLLVGYAAMLRRAELVGIDVNDVVVGTDMELRVRGRRILIPRGRHDVTCPIRAAESWIRGADLRAGPLFVGINRWGQLGGRLSDRSVGLIVQARARGAGLAMTGISADSLRMGPPAERRLL